MNEFVGDTRSLFRFGAELLLQVAQTIRCFGWINLVFDFHNLNSLFKIPLRIQRRMF